MCSTRHSEEYTNSFITYTNCFFEHLSNYFYSESLKWTVCGRSGRHGTRISYSIQVRVVRDLYAQVQECY